MDPPVDNKPDIDDIYEDFEDFDLGKIVEKYQKENKELRHHVQSQEINIQKLAAALEEMQTVNEGLTQNISTLFRTATSELDRKEGIIADLRNQIDNTAFRRRGGQFQTYTNNNNVQIVDNLKNAATNSIVKKEVVNTNIIKEAVQDVDVIPPHSEGEISDNDVLDINTDTEIGERTFKDKYSKQTRENWRQEGDFRDRHNNNGSKSRHNMFQRRYSNYREPDYKKYSGKFDTNRETDTRRNKESDSRRFKEINTRRHKEIDTRRLKNRVDSHRDEYQEIDTRRPKDREDFQEIDTRRPKDREDTYRENFHSRDVRNERDKSNHRRTEDTRNDRRKNDENKRGLIRHNPRRDSSSYLSPTRRRHKSESEKNPKNFEETPKESKKAEKKMLKIVSKLEKLNRGHTPPLYLLPNEENDDKIVPKRTEPIKNFFTDQLYNILDSIQSNVHQKISNSNESKPNTSLQLETIFSEDNFSQEEEISKTTKEKKKKPRRRTITELIHDLFDESQHQPIDNEDIEEEANELKSKKKKKHKKQKADVETGKNKSKKKSVLDILEQELKLESMSDEINFEVTEDLIKTKVKDTASEELIAVDSFSANEKLSAKKTQKSKGNRHNTPVSDSIEKVADYDVEFAPPLKRYIKKCQELSEEQGSLICNAEASNIVKEKIESKKPRKSKELKDIIGEDIRPNSENGTDIFKVSHIEETKTKRKRNSNSTDDGPHQVTNKSKLLKITTPRKSFSPLENIYNEEDAEEIITKKNRRFKQATANLQQPKELSSSVLKGESLKSSECTNSKQKLRSRSDADCTHSAINKSEIARTSPRKSLKSLPEDRNNKEHTEETTKKNRKSNQISDASVVDNITNDLNSCLAENVTKESMSKKKLRSKTLEDSLDNLIQNPELKSSKKDLIVASKDNKNDTEGNSITKTIRSSKDTLDDSFEKNSTFAVVRKKKDSEGDGKCQKESPIKSFTAEEISNSNKDNTRELDKLSECLADATKIDEDQSKNVSNETEVQKLEEKIVPKKKSIRRGLDKETFSKTDKDQTQNVSSEKLDERLVPKKKSNPRGLDKLPEVILIESPSKEEICENSPKTNETSKTDILEAGNSKFETTTNKDSVQTEKLDKNISPKGNLLNDKIVIVSDILLHSGKPKERTTMEAETINQESLRKNNNEIGQNTLPVHLNLPKLIKLETILKESKENSTPVTEEMYKTKIDLSNVNRKLKTSKSVSRKDILLERYASEESQSKLNSTCSERHNKYQNEEPSPITAVTLIGENKAKKHENLEEKINSIRKRKGPEEALGVSDAVPNINPPKKRKVDFKLTETEEGNDKAKQIEEIERTLQLMHKDSKICANNVEDKGEDATNSTKEKEEHTEVNKPKPIPLRRPRNKSIGVAVRKSPRNLKPKTPDPQKSSNKEMSVVENPTVVITVSDDDKEKLKQEDEEEDEIVSEEIKSGPENLETNSNKTEICKTNVSAAPQLDLPNLSVDNKNIDDKAPAEQKISPIAKQKNAHHLPPPLGNIPVTSTSSPIGQLTKARKRITPTPVKDAPVCSFQNILKTNNSEFKIFSKNFVLESDLNLTDDGEIPILHLEDNHFNNMEDATQKTFDRSIMKLLDCMNVSNLDCDISKINEKVEGPAPNNSLTFENVIGKASNDGDSTPVKNRIQPSIPVSSTPKVNQQILTAAVGTVAKTVNVPNTANGSETGPSSNLTNTPVQGPLRFRRRCRIIAVRKL